MICVNMPQMVRSLNVIYPPFQASFPSLFHSFLVHTVYTIPLSHSLHFDASFFEKKLQHLFSKKGKSFAASATCRSSSSSDMLPKFKAESVSFHSAINCSFTDRKHTGNLLDCEALFQMIFQY